MKYINPDWISIYVLETVWGPYKDTSGKMAGANKEKNYRNHFKGCFSEGINEFNWKGMRKEINWAACHGQASDLEGKRGKHISKNEWELLGKNCWLLKSTYLRENWHMRPDPRKKFRKGRWMWIFNIFVCVHMCVCTHTRAYTWMDVHIYICIFICEVLLLSQKELHVEILSKPLCLLALLSHVNE